MMVEDLTMRARIRFLSDNLIQLPGPVIDQANEALWKAEGSSSLRQPLRLDEASKKELSRLIGAEARRYGMGKMPEAGTNDAASPEILAR